MKKKIFAIFISWWNIYMLSSTETMSSSCTEKGGQVSTLCHLTDNSFQSSQVLKLEIHVLKALNFDLTIADPTTFLDRYLEIETNQDS
jgi:hypothetical protein